MTPEQQQIHEETSRVLSGDKLNIIYKKKDGTVKQYEGVEVCEIKAPEHREDALMIVKDKEGTFKSFYRRGILNNTLMQPVRLASTYTYMAVIRRFEGQCIVGRKNPEFIAEIKLAEAARGRKHKGSVTRCSWCNKGHLCRHQNETHFATFAIQYLDGVTPTAWGELLPPGITFTAAICNPIDVPNIREGAKLANIRLRSPHACAFIAQSQQEKDLNRYPALTETIMAKFLMGFPFTPYDLKSWLTKKIEVVEETAREPQDQQSVPVSHE